MARKIVTPRRSTAPQGANVTTSVTPPSATTVESDMAVHMPNGDYNVLLVSGKSSYTERQNLASCLLSVLKDPDSLSIDDGKNDGGWTVAYIVTIAKALLDSMDLEGRGGQA